MTTSQEYAVRGGTLPKTIRSGYLLAHNNVKHDEDTPNGWNGFRAWYQKGTALPFGGKLVKCACGWAGLTHYKVKKETR